VTQQQPQGLQEESHPDAFRGIERTPEEWWRRLEALLRPKEAKP